MIKVFGIEDKISNMNLEYFTKLKENLDKADITGSLFFGFPVIELGGMHQDLRGLLITKKGLIAFYEQEQELNLYKRHFFSIGMGDERIANLLLNNPNDIFIGINIKDKFPFEDFKLKNDIMTENDILLVNGLLQHIYNLVPNDDRIITNEKSLGHFIKQRNMQIANLDEKQFKMVYNENNSHMRIRGLAGSGKTILLVKKMAYLHFKDRELSIAYVFFGKSLKQYIKELFVRFYKEFEKFGKEPDWNKIKIFHCWGTKIAEGFYTNICKLNEISTQPYNGLKSFDIICKELLDELGEKRIDLYDYVLIDEAQDLRLNFFKLAKKSLRPYGKLIYAYDELQIINAYDSKMPSKTDIFGEEKCEDLDLSFCYRSPMKILVTAHALGLGIYHKNSSGKFEFINFIDDPSVWKAIGYKIESGDLIPNKEVILYRDEIIKNEINDLINIEEVSSNDLFKKIANIILDLLSKDDVKPEDILIIDLDSLNLDNNFMLFKSVLWYEIESRKMYNDQGKRLIDTNLVNKDKAFSFRISGSVPYTTIFRAKGNEANIVLILNAHKMDIITTYNRNRIFTALTRTKFKAYIFGEGNQIKSLINEFETIKGNNYKLIMRYPTAEELARYKDRAYQESKELLDIQRVIDLSQQIKSTDPTKLVKLILEQTGKADINQLIEFLQQMQEEDNK